MEGRFALDEEIEVRLLAPKSFFEANAECDYIGRALTQKVKGRRFDSGCLATQT